MKRLFSIRTLKVVLGLFFLGLAAYAGIEDIKSGEFINDSKTSYSLASRIPLDFNANSIAYSNRPIFYGLCAITGALLLFGEVKEK